MALAFAASVGGTSDENKQTGLTFATRDSRVDRLDCNGLDLIGLIAAACVVAAFVVYLIVAE